MNISAITLAFVWSHPGLSSSRGSFKNAKKVTRNFLKMFLHRNCHVEILLQNSIPEGTFKQKQSSNFCWFLKELLRRNTPHFFTFRRNFRVEISPLYVDFCRNFHEETHAIFPHFSEEPSRRNESILGRFLEELSRRNTKKITTFPRNSRVEMNPFLCF